MRFRLTLSRIICALALVAVGCAPPVARPITTSALGSAPAQAGVIARADQLERILAASKDLGSVPDGREVSLLVALKDQKAAAREAAAAEIYDPRSPGYGRYLSPSQFAAAYGADPADVNHLLA